MTPTTSNIFTVLLAISFLQLLLKTSAFSECPKCIPISTNKTLPQATSPDVKITISNHPFPHQDDLPQNEYTCQCQNSNWGDLVSFHRQLDDKLLLRAVYINERRNRDQEIVLEDHVRGNVTQVRGLNFGRQRGYIKAIRTAADAGGTKIEVTLWIRAGYEVRILFEVYGYED